MENKSINILQLLESFRDRIKSEFTLRVTQEEWDSLGINIESLRDSFKKDPLIKTVQPDGNLDSEMNVVNFFIDDISGGFYFKLIIQ